MITYIIKRIGMTILVCILAMVFLASMVHFIPGDPVQTLLGPRATPERSAKVREMMGLDDPVPVQVYDFVINALQGDLGVDFVSGRSVTEIILESLPHTFWLAVLSLGLAALIGVPLGVFSAARPNSFADRITSILSISFITMPSFVAALLLLLIFAVELGWFPAIGVGEPDDPMDYLKHLILPSVALAITWIGYLARLVRASMLEILNETYIRTALSFGLHGRIVFYKHALRNAIIPTVAVLGVGLGNLLGGAIFTEVIFTRPGLGRLIYDAIADRNYPIVRGGILVAAIFFVLANLITDLSYHFLDPRIRLEEKKG